MEQTAQNLQNSDNSSELISLDKLPIFPDIVLKLFELIQNEYSTNSEMAALINTSPTLLAQLLRYANSPRYSVGCEVMDTTFAIGVIGRHPAVSLLTTAALRETFNEFSNQNVTLADFFRYGIAVAATIGVISEYHDTEMSLDATAIGVLHNIGELGLLHTIPSRYQRDVIESENRATSSRHSREKETLGIDHYTFGANLMRKWGIPANYCDMTASIPEQSKLLCDGKELTCLRSAIAHTRINYAICPKWWLSEAGEFSPELINGETVSDILELSVERHEKLANLLI